MTENRFMVFALVTVVALAVKVTFTQQPVPAEIEHAPIPSLQLGTAPVVQGSLYQTHRLHDAAGAWYWTGTPTMIAPQNSTLEAVIIAKKVNCTEPVAPTSPGGSGGAAPPGHQPPPAGQSASVCDYPINVWKIGQ